ncbi:MAG: ParA family protein [Clostridia bacterium]|nr:ParA family protein [Clostridia bacterium]
MNKIISFTNQKGGVGKTTTCVNISAYMAKLGLKVLIIDFDPQGNASTAVGIEKLKIQNTIYGALSQKYSIENCIHHTKIDNLDIIPSELNLAGAEIELVDMENKESVLKTLISPLTTRYDFIMIDCPPSLSLLTINALTASTDIIIPIQCEFFALEGLSQLMNTVRLVKKHLNKDLNIEGVVLTMKESRINLINQVTEEIKNFFGKKVYDTAIPKNVRLAEAPSFGEPICNFDSKCKGALSYKQLTEEILSKQGILLKF